MISVVIPIWNEEENIPALHPAIAGVMQGIGEPWEVIYVNDGSSDTSMALLQKFQETDPHVRVVELSRNWGHQAAITAGLATARGEAVVLMDGDFQDPPEVIPNMVNAWKGGAKVVVAQRTSRAEKGLRGRMFPLFYKFLGYLSDFPIPLNAGIFGLLDRQAVDSINRLTEGNRYLPGLRAWVGYSTAVVFYDRADRAAGEPKQNFRRLFKYAMDAIFSFSYKPLRLALALGTIITGLSLVAGVAFAIAGALNGLNNAVGYTTIATLLFIGGIQLICVGIVGEYIGRIYDEVRKRPLFLASQIHEPRAKFSTAAGDSQAA